MKKLSAGTLLVLPATDMVMGILDRMEIFAEKPGRELFAEMMAYKPGPKDTICGINRNSVGDLVKAIYLELLQESSEWAKLAGPENYIDNQWKKMVRGWEDNVSRKLENQMFTAVIREAYDEIHDWLNEFDDGEPSWHVWFVRRHGLDIAIEKGPDYRILDWERRMRAGADYLKAQEAGEPLSPEAWVPDAEGRRFAELLTQQQSEASALGKTVTDEMDKAQKQARARNKLNPKRRGALQIVGRTSHRKAGTL